MTRKRSKSLFVLFSIILVILLIASFVSFTYPLSVNGNYYSYSSFISNLRLGEDISNGLRIVYRAELPEGELSTNYNNLLQSTKYDLKNIVEASGYQDVTVADYGDDGIVVNIGNILTKTDFSDLINLVGSPETISFYMGDKTETSKPLAVAGDIASVSAQEYYDASTAQNIFYVRIDFKDRVKDYIADETAEGGTMNIYFGDTQFTSMDLGDSGITEGIITIQSEAFDNMTTTTYYANKIKTGMLSLELTQIECDEITPSYGLGADMLLSIAMLVFVVAGFAFLIVKYKHMGWIACFNLLFYITIGLFLLQSIPVVNINFAGMVAMLIVFLLAIDSLMTIIERAKAYYNKDTKLHIAFKMAQKESLARIMFNNALMVVAGFICILLPSATLKSFGWVALVMSFVNMFTSLVMMRLFVNMYLPFNNTDGKKCNFHKGGKNA